MARVDNKTDFSSHLQLVASPTWTTACKRKAMHKSLLLLAVLNLALLSGKSKSYLPGA